MTEKYSTPNRFHLSWIQSLNILILLIYLLIFMEWLFHVTKPSFLSMLEPRERFSVLFVTPLPLLLFATFALTLGWSVGFFLRSRFGQAVQIWTGRCLSVLFLAMTLILVADNFTYTLFRISVGNSHVLMFFPYILLITVLAFCGIRSMERRMARRGSATIFYGTTVLLTALSLFFCTGGREQFEPRIVLKADGGQRPNIVLVSGDGIDANRMSIYGFERETTPFLRQLKESALFFENAFPNGATTTASVTSMLTGKPATKTHVIYPPDILRGKDAYEHLPGILRKLGYANLEISIRHYCDPIDLNMRGAFERSNFRDTRGMVLAERLERWMGQEATYFLNLVGERFLYRFFPILSLDLRMSDAYREVKGAGINQDKERVEEFARFVKSEPGPFFAHVHLLGTHGAKFRPRERKFSVGQEQNQNWMVDFYDDAILDFDNYINKIVDILRSEDRFQNTVMIVTSDHGQKYAIDQRIPLLIRFPGRQLAGTIKTNVQLLDLAPTILDYLGLAPPEWMDGRSLIAEPLDRLRPVLSVRPAVDTFALDGGLYVADTTRGMLRSFTSPRWESRFATVSLQWMFANGKPRALGYPATQIPAWKVKSQQLEK